MTRFRRFLRRLAVWRMWTDRNDASCEHCGLTDAEHENIGGCW